MQAVMDRALGRMQGTYTVLCSILHGAKSRVTGVDRPNIVMIGIDTLRADHLGCYGYHRHTSPHLDRLAREGLVFRQCFSTSSWTPPAWSSVFTGLLPSQHGLLQYPHPGVLRPDVPTLAELLKDTGYVAGGFHGGGFVDANFGLARGFIEYATYGTRFGNSLDAVRQWLHWHRRWPFFLFWHGFDCHMPYDPSAKFDQFDLDYCGDFDVSKLYRPDGALPHNEDDHHHVVAKYDGEIACADSALGQLLYELECLQLLDRTLVMVLSDHGEEFLEHGCYDHIRTLYDELVRVPLIVKLPGWGLRGESQDLVSLADIAPMICKWIGLEFPNCHGKSLDALRSEPRMGVFAETGYKRDYLKESASWSWQHKKNRPHLLRSVRTRHWKLLLDEQDRCQELYDLQLDPGERFNCVDARAQVANELMSTFWTMGPGIKAQEIVANSYDSDEIDEIVVDRLRALGYFS